MFTKGLASFSFDATSQGCSIEFVAVLYPSMGTMLQFYSTGPVTPTGTPKQTGFLCGIGGIKLSVT